MSANKTHRLVKVYGLFALSNPKVFRYIGQCIIEVEERVRNHFKEAKKDTKNRWVYNWIKKHNFQIGYRILEEDAVWNESEIKWKKKLQEEGHRLTNMTDGGDGFLGGKHSKNWSKRHSEIMKQKWQDSEFRKKMSIAMSLNSRKGKPCPGNKGKIRTKEWLKKLSESQKGKPRLYLRGIVRSEEFKKKISIANKGKKRTKEQIERMRIAAKGYKFSEQHKKNVSEAVTKWWQNRRENNVC